MLDKAKSAVTDFHSYIKSKIRWTKYVIADAPDFCKDLFSLKCNQFTMRDCALKNFAIQYIDINSRNAEKIANEADDNGDAQTAEQYRIIADVMHCYVQDLEHKKQFLVKQKEMPDKEVHEATFRHPSLWKQSEKK